MTGRRPTRLQRLRTSMAAFDAMPADWRRFCADYPRTTNGQTLAAILRDCDDDVLVAMDAMRQLMPVERV